MSEPAPPAHPAPPAQLKPPAQPASPILPAPTLAAAMLKGLCPRCGAPTLFAGVARFAPTCPQCGLDFASFDVADGPAAFLILIVGTIVAVAAILVDLAYSPRWYVHLVWLPVMIGLTLAGLRIGKAGLMYQIFHHRAGEGRLSK